MSNNFKMDDYIDVAERLVEFHARYPEGSLQTISWSVETVADKVFIVYRAAAYRSPDDRRPAMGIAWEPFPGQSNFTRNSELMNAETAAWGRAILACGLTAKRALASRQEVQNRVAEQEQEKAPKPASKPTRAKTPAKASKAASAPPSASRVEGLVTTETLEELARQFRASGVTNAELSAMFKEVGAEGKKSGELTEDEATWIVLKLRDKVKAHAEAA